MSPRGIDMGKKMLVAALALSAASCGAQQVAGDPLPPGYVTLATFTAEVDTAAGTFVIRTVPASGGDASSASNLVLADPTEVTVANNGAAWSNVSTEKGCGLVPTWGASVTVTNKLASPTSVAGVYAEITSFAGPAGNTACNAVSNAARPAGMSNALGLWSYGTLQPANGASSTNWTFTYTSGARFTFSGRILGVKVASFATPGTLPGFVNVDGAITAFGTDIVYGETGNSGKVAYVNAATGALDGTEVTTVAGSLVSAVAGDAVNDRVWFAGAVGGVAHVGVITGPGRTVVEASAGSGQPQNLFVDPRDATLVWFRTTGTSNIRSARFTTGSPGSVTVTAGGTSIGGNSQAMAMGLDNNLYVSYFLTGIEEYSTNAVTGVATLVKTYAPGTGCSGTMGMLWVASTSTLWVAGNSAGNVCAVTFTGTGAGRTATWTVATPIPAGFVNVRQMVWAPSGRAAPDDFAVWGTNTSNNTLMRADAGFAGYSLTMPIANTLGVGSAPQGAAVAADGKIWTGNNAGIFRIEP